MIYYIKGKVEYIGDDYVVLDNQDIGYKVCTSHLSIMDLQTQFQKVTLYTQMIHRDDDMSLYGFTTQKELKMFQLLMTVSGIGAKVALGILSSIPLDTLVEVIVSEDISGLIKAQGVGKKTAQRIILELKDKIVGQIGDVGTSSFLATSSLENWVEEATSALLALGYGRTEAVKAVQAVKDSCENVEEAIKMALKYLTT